MRSSTIWGIVACLATVVLTASFIWTGFDHIPYTARTDPDTKVLVNPYLAWERMGDALGRHVEPVKDAARLDELPARGVLIFDSDRFRAMNKEHVAALLRWTNSGGHLIVVAESDGKDPLLDAFGVVRGDTPVFTPLRGAPQALGQSSFAQPFTLLVAGIDKPLRGELKFPVPIKSLRLVPDWATSTRSGPVILHFTRGQGALTVLSTFSDLVGNNEITRSDNAAIAWTLVNLVNPEGPILLFSHLHVVSLWEWLYGSAWAVLLAAGILLVAGIWRAMPRFGPLAAAPTHERRALADHLSAMGRAVWRVKEEEGLRYWLQCARRAVIARAAMRDPSLMRQTPAEQARRIAARLAGTSGVDARQIRLALAGTSTVSEGSVAREGFARVIAILQRVEQHLK